MRQKSNTEARLGKRRKKEFHDWGERWKIQSRGRKKKRPGQIVFICISQEERKMELFR